MTLVLASRCVDGAIVIAYRAITDLRTLEILKYDNKVIIWSNLQRHFWIRWFGR
jgi:hypothetical protein